jgi:hypothetical protein
VDSNNWPRWAAGVVPRLKQPIKRTKIKKSYSVKVDISGTSENYEEMSRRLAVLTDPTLMAHELRTAVLMSVVVNVRNRFIRRMERALEMRSISQDGKAVTISPRKRMRDMQLKASLADAFASLTEADIAGDAAASEAARERISGLNERMREAHGKGPNGQTYESHPLSNAQGNVFRMQMYALLGLITAPDMVTTRVVGNTSIVGIGEIPVIDSLLETPSATRSLSGRGTTSPYRSFWRHLEFGTGVERSAAKDMKRNKVAGMPLPWTYGTREQGSLVLAGTAPMNFLTDITGAMYDEDLQALDDAIRKVLKKILHGD